MTIFKKRYAAIGWLTVVAGKRYAKRRMRRLAHR
jgi:hypothetical protein